MRQSRSGRLLKTMLIGLALAACATPVRSDDLTATIDAQIRENARAHGIPAQAVIVMRNGRLIYRGQLGVAESAAGVVWCRLDRPIGNEPGL
jgi:hypothetical protein